MTALEDHRPVAATTTISRHPNVIGEDLAQLLLEHPDLELASIRLIPSTEHDGVGIVGRVGPLAEQTAEYPCCHQLIGRPHTEYCQLVDHASQLTHAELYPNHMQQIHREVVRPACSNPHANGLDGRGCQDPECPRHGWDQHDHPDVGCQCGPDSGRDPSSCPAHSA